MKIWPGAHVEQLAPLSKEGTSTRAGVALITKPNSDTALERKITVAEKDKELVQTTKIKLNATTSVSSIYIGRPTSGGTTEHALNRIIGGGGHR